MKPNDPNVRWVGEPQLGLAGKIYLPLITEGLTTTARRLAKTLKGEPVTVSYPDEEPEIGAPLIYRGVHRLNRDERGRVKCVACFLCATACPAHCIDIVAAESPWPDREKYPESFTIDELRCIYCGMCEEACPVDAIELTSLYNLTGRSREEMVFDKQKLLSVYDETKDREPMRTGGAWCVRWPAAVLLGGVDGLAWRPQGLGGLALAALGLLLMVPPASRTRRRCGAALGLAGLVWSVSAAPAIQPWVRHAAFWTLAGVAVASAAAMAAMRSAVYAAVWFALCLTGVAGLLLMLGAQFLAAATLVVYAGAIVVTLLFVIMLAQPQGLERYDRLSWGLTPRVASVAAAAVLAATVAVAAGRQREASLREQAAAALDQASAGAQGEAAGRWGELVCGARLLSGRGGRVLRLTLRSDAPAAGATPEAVRRRLAGWLQSAAPGEGGAAPRLDVVVLDAERSWFHPSHAARFGTELFAGRLIAVEAAGTLLLAALTAALAVLIRGRRAPGGAGKEARRD